jgi:hypothetical protein
VRHIVARMFDFDEDNNKLPFEEVLVLWVEQAEAAYEAAQENSQPNSLTAHRAEIDRRKGVRTEAMKMHVELNTAADDIDQGHGRPYLVLSKPDYKRGQVKFTIRSLYIWAKECHGKQMTEWAPPEDQAPGSSQEGEYAPQASALGHLETSSIIAGALGGLIDKLVEDDRIEHPTKKPCISDDDCVDMLAVAEYIAMTPSPEGTTPQNGGSIEGTHLAAIADIEPLTLGLVAHTFCSLAERARVSQWVVFRDKYEEVIGSPFHRRGKYVSSKIYDYLKKTGAINHASANQKISSINHRLGAAQQLINDRGLPRLSVDQLQGLFQMGSESTLQRDAK